MTENLPIPTPPRPKGRPRVLPPPKRTKVSRACDLCKHHKRKCNGDQPCFFCKDKSLNCTYLKVDGRSKKSKTYQDQTRQNSALPNGGLNGQEQQQHEEDDDDGEIEPEIPSLTNSPTSSRRASTLSNVPNTVSTQLSLSTICKSLQTALSNDDNSNKKAQESQEEGLSNLNGQHTRLLSTHNGDKRFFGESSALSLLSECRALFLDILGPSTFTNDPAQHFIHDESVDFTKNVVATQLPLRKDALILIDLFKTNINDTFYVFNMNYFMTNIFEDCYRNPVLADSKKLCLLNFVFAIGTLFVEYSSEIILDLPPSHAFMETGEQLMRNNIYDGKLWMAEANFLKYFYYQACCNRSSSWICLGTAIRLGQALGLHRRVINDRIDSKEISVHRRRFWRSLYVCDCVSSVNLGRPLMIATYDYDDINFPLDQLLLPDEKDQETERVRIMAQNATSDSAVINRSIIENSFRSQINLKDTNSLSLQLKLWSIELPPELQLSKAMEEDIIQNKSPNSYLLVFVHIGQLYGIMALTRPFLVYVAIRKLKPSTKKEVGNEKQLMPFCKAAIKAAFLTIKLIRHFCVNTNRKEVFTIQSATFFAAILLGFTLLEQSKSKKADHHYMSVIKESIQDAIQILNTFPFNATCNRWSQHLTYMMDSLNMSINNPNSDTSPTSSITSDTQNFNDDLIRWNQENAFDQLLNFQQYFVPNDIDILNNNYLDAFNYMNTRF
ncbi:FGR27 Filamentous growth regulator 27 [Candida maltosa Xu316]